MRSCFVGSLLGLEVGGRTRTLGTCRRARRSGSVVACVSEEGKVEGGPPKVRRDIGLHQSWYIYYEEGNKCVVCFGKGEESCSYCYGDGYIVIGADAVNDRAVCPLCEGAKKLECRRCKGSGVRPSTRYNPMTNKEERNLTNAEVLESARKEQKYTANQPKAEPTTTPSAQDEASQVDPVTIPEEQANTVKN